MVVIRLLAPALMCAAIATPVSADVTLRSKRTATIPDAGSSVIDTTEYRKGLRVRTDLSGPITSNSVIVDAGDGARDHAVSRRQDCRGIRPPDEQSGGA